ncbi:MAG: sulfite exporter TauE/SafE family protein [candidate division Zixibacteria bacterium]|nr:sulfite exporter TauE/SafE family protein [candidate division Zixibacteria bacterium]
MTAAIAGLLVGLLGSLHCAGMCGPIVAALPADPRGRFSFLTGRIIYNLGRVVTYAVIGAIFGLVGRSLFIAGYQQALSIALGVLIILAIALPRRYSHRLISWFGLEKLFARISSVWGMLFRNSSKPSMFLIGVLNGFLPCGFVYLALAGAVATGSILGGAAYMAAFGIGTMPILLAFAYVGDVIGHRWKQSLRRALPVLASVLALLFILRGLSLGIPYLSPDLHMNQATQTVESSCCKPPQK